MAKLLERIGVWGVLVLVAAVVVAYSLWGAAVLREQHVGGTLTKSVSAALSIL